MSFKSLKLALNFLEKNDELIRIKEPIDPHLEMAAIHLLVHKNQGPAILFENVKDNNYQTCSNIFGSERRCELLFSKQVKLIQQLIEGKLDPQKLVRLLLNKPISTLQSLLQSRPLKLAESTIRNFDEIQIENLPLIKHWQLDGGAFITLPQVYTENLDQPGVQHSNVGMYRIQLTGNQYQLNAEIGLHYQLHRGIGVHHSIAKKNNLPLKVSIFVGGPPAHSLAAVCPLPENISELGLAGVLNQRRFRYFHYQGYVLSADADFNIIGTVAQENKMEGPFGDHLGYYSLQHEFPVIKVEKVFAKRNAIWSFTVVGRPPQEDTYFGSYIHKIFGSSLLKLIPGLKAIEAVDEAGVHPLALAIGTERYTPYLVQEKPAEIITTGLQILGTGQLSLTKYLFITFDSSNTLTIKPYQQFFNYILARVVWAENLHFITNTTMDTLDYSANSLNEGSKLLISIGEKKQRNVCEALPDSLLKYFSRDKIFLINDGILIVESTKYMNETQAHDEIQELINILQNIPECNHKEGGIPLIVLTETIHNIVNFSDFLWVCFTRSNPANDIYGVDSFIRNKHWGCNGSLIIDARMKPFIPPILEIPDEILGKAKKIINNYPNFK